MTRLEELDRKIYNCFDEDNPRSFFLYAGAGSGKTRSLKNVLQEFGDQRGSEFKKSKKRIAVITYTNAACDEIKVRVKYDPLFHILTIHSFCWELIRAYTEDIRDWVKLRLVEDVKKIKAEIEKGRASKTQDKRIKRLASKKKRLAKIDEVTAFTYNPNGDNRTRDAVHHHEVIGMASDFLVSNPLMGKILVASFPILLVDESQDTNKSLIEALLAVENHNSCRFTLGLFGDTMQRIYFDGKADLDSSIPDRWITPEKTINYRSTNRIVTLINKIRFEADGRQQTPREGQQEGFVRLFLVKNGADLDKQQAEKIILTKMAEITSDEKWSDVDQVKMLTLEHHMAARRMGFNELFVPIYAIDSYKDRLLDGTLGPLAFFTRIILPLVDAHLNGDDFLVARIVCENSELISFKQFNENPDQLKYLSDVKELVDGLVKLAESKDTSLMVLLRYVHKHEIFDIPDQLIPLCVDDEAKGNLDAEDFSTGDKQDVLVGAWENALQASLDHVRRYEIYISDKGRFGTHQGVKGLEFERVLVIADDEESRGRTYSYEKLFGAAPLSKKDLENLKDGKDSSLDKVRRLFYVTCSRAKQSLAVVTYSSSLDSIKKTVIDKGWFSEEEIIVL